MILKDYLNIPNPVSSSIKWKGTVSFNQRIVEKNILYVKIYKQSYLLEHYLL